MKLVEEMPSPTFVDLKPDRLLLDPKFDGYKLSLESLPIYCLPLSKGIDRVSPADDQYSIQHAKLFGHHNCLNHDDWNPSLFFLVDDEWNINKIIFDIETAKFSSPQVIWNIPTKVFKKTGRYNVSIVFPDEKYAVLSDGCGTLFILDTGNRLNSSNWQVVKQLNFQEDCNNKTTSGLDQFLVTDVKMYKCMEKQVMDILLIRVCDKNEQKFQEFLNDHESQFIKKSANHPFVTTLSWLTMALDNGKWDVKSSRTLIGPSGVDYACIEPEGTGIFVASENNFAFSYVSDGTLKYTEKNSKELSEETQETKPEYFWMQNSEEIAIWFKIPIGARKQDFIVDIKPSSISLSYNKNVMLEGEFIQQIKAEETVWTITPASSLSLEVEDNSSSEDLMSKCFQCLEINLQKVELSNWDGESFVKGNKRGQQIFDPEVIAQIHASLEHLCSERWDSDSLRSNVVDPQQLEECDGFPADSTSFMRIDRELQCITHVASLGSHQWLFNTKVHDALIPAICVRHDVDGLVWQPKENKGDIWKLNHIGTFSAMGYVQASKQQRRFTVAPPDLSYVAICDAVKHVYIYRQPNPIETDLRNRRTGAHISHISRQQIVSIDPPLDTLGAFACNNFLYVLTCQNLHVIRIKELRDL